MAVDLHTLPPCEGGIEASPEGGDEKGKEPEPPSTTACGGGDVAEVVVYKKGAWSKEEDEKLRRAVDKYGLRNWVAIEKFSGLARPAKNCRLRWLNYLRPNLKKYPFTQEEEELIFRLHSKYGNSWSRIAAKLPGRSDNEIKNFWHKKAKKRHKHHLPIYPNHTNLPNTIINHTYSHNESNADNEYFPNYPNQTLPSQSSELQPSTPNALRTPRPSNDTSPQTVISTPPPQFISSPASSSYQKQSPTNYVTDQTSTPTSHNTQNLLLSPNPTDQTPLLITNSSNAFTPLRKPPILSSPNGPLRRFSRAASKLSPDSSMQMQSSSAMESPRSPLKLNLSPRIPYTAPISPLKLRLSIPIPPESCFQSNLSITDSTVQLSSSTDAAPQMNGLESPPIQPMSVNTNNIINVDSSQTIKTEPPSIQVYQPVTPGANSGVHEVEPDNDSEIMEELREAQSRVRFLKKKLRLRRISNKRSLKGSSETTDLLKTEVPLDKNSSESSRTKNFLDDILGVKAPPKNSRKNVRRGDMIGISNEGALQVTSGSKENRLCELQRREDLETEKYTQGSVESEKPTRDGNLETKTMQNEEDSLGNILKRNNSMTFQDQRISIDLFDHLNIQNTMNAPNSDSWDYSKLCPFQGPAGKSLNECSTIEGLFSESSTLLQDSSFQGDLFGQRTEIEAFGPVYSQSTATTLVKPVDDGAQLSFLQPYQDVYFGYSFGRENSTEDGLMDDNLAVKSILSESNLFLDQYPSADLLDSSHLESTPNMEHESSECREFSLKTSGGESQLRESGLLLHQYPSANLLESGYLVSKQIIEQESLRGEQYFLQTPGGHSAETSKLCEPTLLLHQSPPANLIEHSGYLMSFEHGCPQEEPSREQSLMQDLLVENLWPEGQVVPQDQTFSTDRFQCGVVDLMESENWNHESGCGNAGVLKQEEQEHDNMNTMSEELSSLLEFFPTNIQTLEWYNIPDTKASDEFDMGGPDLQMSSTSQPLLTIADHI